MDIAQVSRNAKKSKQILTVDEIQREACAMLEGSIDGEPLDLLTETLIDLGVKVSVTCLDQEAIRLAIAAATHAGATPTQIQETVALVSGLGVHSLMASARTVLEISMQEPGFVLPPLTPAQRDLWSQFVGNDPYWVGFEAEMPGFLDALLRLSPELFRGFFDYCAIPWRMGSVRALTKELISMACDASPSHRFGPGMRLHLRNALKLGAGRSAITRALAIAAGAPEHPGTI